MNFFNKIAFIAITTIALVSCDNEDNDINISGDKVAAYIEFDNVFGQEDFELHKKYTTANHGEVTLSTLKYIITDITLHGSNGTEDYTASTQESFHIVDASCEASVNKFLTKVPNGTYNRVTLRYGVSDHFQNLGIEEQGAVYAAAKEAKLDWGWTLGYRYMTFEGSYVNGHNHRDFKIHNGATGALTTDDTHHEQTSRVQNAGNPHAGHGSTTTERKDNSKLIELSFEQSGEILVSDKTSPKIHLKVDVAKILASTHILDISEDIIVDAHKSTQVAVNVSTMFSVEHIHPTSDAIEVPVIETCEDTSNPNDGGDHDHNSHNH